mmetsp:Transcript_23026/g.35529  ORF Transcript_23026/g.35529 Transcript_23026/m.35529 type:complete len:317 (-) Transcript_23026:2318-3268(-)
MQRFGITIPLFLLHCAIPTYQVYAFRKYVHVGAFVASMRGGDQYFDEYSYDGEYDDADGEHSDISEGDEHDTIDDPRTSRYGNRNSRGPPPQSRRAKRKTKTTINPLQAVQSLTVKTTSLAVTSTKAVASIATPRYVTINDLVGTWRFDQSIFEKDASDLSEVTTCAANIQFDKKGNLSTSYNGKVMKSRYVFRQRSWPRFCTIEFEARAFQGPADKQPVLMFYKGVFKRKVMRKSVVKIEGKIYAISGRGVFRKKVCVGSFVARKRMAPAHFYLKENRSSADPGDNIKDDEEENNLGSEDEEEYDEEEYDDALYD